jgi:hypothetical protein
MTPDCQQVLAVLKDVSDVLAVGLPHALSAGIDQRHAYQEQVLDMACEALRSGRRHADDTKAEATAALEAERLKLQACTSHVEVAASEQVAAEKALAEKQVAHDSAVAAVNIAQENHMHAEAAKEMFVKGMGERRIKRDRAASIIDGTLSMLRDGGWGDAETCEDCISAVKEFLEGFSAENTLIAAFPGALRMHPEQRRPFDKMIEQSVIDVVTAELKRLEEEVNGGIAEEQHVNAEALGLWAILDQARAAAADTERELEEASNCLKEASSSSLGAHAAVKSQNDFVAQRTVEEETCHKRIVSFDNALVSLERLRAISSESTESKDDVTMTDGAAPDVTMTDGAAPDVPMVELVAEESCAAAAAKDCNTPASGPVVVRCGGA